MRYDDLSRIRGNIAIYSRRKTTNLLEGGFRSVHRGRSLEFEDLKEYQFGDNVHDIDWKSSSRTGKTLIRRYVAQRKHNLLFVCDSGRKMMADSSAGESKSDLEEMCMGVIAFLADRQGADFSMASAGTFGMEMNPFRSGPAHIEELLHAFRKTRDTDSSVSLGQILERTVGSIPKKMIVVLLTDIGGLASLTERQIRLVTLGHDLLVVNIDDAYLSDRAAYAGAYDVEEECYVDDFFLGSRSLLDAEKRERDRIMANAADMFKKYRVSMVTVSRESEIVEKTVELFRKNAQVLG